MSNPPPTPGTAPDWAVSTRNLRKTYRGGATVAVAGLDLNIPRGGVHGFLGPNGSGKTTTLRMLLGLITPDSGTMHLFGRPVPDALPEVIDRVGAIIEQPRLFPTLSARTNLRLLAQGIGVPFTRVGEVLEQVGLAGRDRDDVGRYSLGMRQRLAIAATLLKDPDLLIFDEPTNGLDPAGIHEIRTTLRALAADGKTVLLSSHLLSEVQAVADTVTIIGRGRMLREGRVNDILNRGPASVRVVVGEADAAAHVLTAAGFTVVREPDASLRVGRVDAGVAGSEVARVLGEASLWPSELGEFREDLEGIFLELTQGEHLTATQSDGSSARRALGGAA